MKIIFGLLFIVSFLSSCTYYKVRTQLSETDDKIETIRRNDIQRYIVVHVGEAMWELKNPRYHGNDSISGELVELSSESRRVYYYNKIRNRNSAVVPKRDRNYIDQVHLYVDMVNLRGSDVSISKEYIQRIDVYNLNVGATVASHTVVIAGSAVAAFGIFLAIVCNCPHVYTTDGESYTYSQSLYTGAVSPNLERHDYQLMPDYFKKSEVYDIILKNDLKEEQYTNMLELIVVEHEVGDKIVPNQQGEFYSVSKAVAPTSAKSEAKDDLLSQLVFEDGNAYAFNRLDDDGFSNIYLEFEGKQVDQDAQLVLTVKNTKWGGYVYDEFASLFGKSYAKRSKRRANLSKEELEATMLEHGMPIQVSIKKNGAWIDIESINLVGDVAYNTLAVNIPKEFIGSEKLEIRLKTGYMFWDIDYVGMDFSQKTALTASKHPAYEVTPDGEIVRSASLAQDDKTYMEHLQTGDSAVLQFQHLPVNDQLERTIVLHSKGYYLDRKEYSGKMDRMALMRFRKEGELSRYSQELYQNQILQALSKAK